MIHRAVIGAAIGAGVGIFLVSTSVVLTTYWLLFMFWPFAVPLLAAVVGGAIGHFSARGRSPIRYFWLWLVVLISILPLCAMLPVWVRKAHIQSMLAEDIPACPNCREVKKSIAPYAADNSPGYTVEFDCSNSPGKAIVFYQTELSKEGWELLPTLIRGESVYHRFRRNGRVLYVIGWESSNWNEARLVSKNKVRFDCSVPNLFYRPSARADEDSKTSEALGVSSEKLER